MPTVPTKALETFPNPEPERDYIIEIEAPEFTCLCPKTGQPDFATLELEYIPDRLCVELKSLKLYIWSFRDEGHFHEKVTNTILNDLVAATQPRYMRLRALFYVRGGITTTVTAEHRKPGWQPLFPPLPELPRKKRSASADRPQAATSAAPAAATSAPVPAPPVVPERSAAVGPGAARTAPAPVAPVATPAAPPPPPPARGDAAEEGAAALHGPRSDRFRMLARKRGTAAPPADTAASAPPAPVKPQRDIYIGIDVGTSGCRAIALDADEKLLAQAETPLPPPLRFEGQVTQDPADWWTAVSASLKQLLSEIDPTRVHRMAVAGTSGTLVLCDKKGSPTTPGLMYNDRRADAEAERIAAAADDSSAGYDACGSLAKLLWLQDKKSHAKATYVLHQADWISNRLIGNYGHSDYHNSLKLGYDPVAERWPPWFKALGVPTTLLPYVNRPGEPIGTVTTALAESLGLPAGTEVVAGTTDGVAAFLASGASKPGHGVTVLGSTLVLKLLSEKQITARANGVYSHRLGRYWLVGGASNSGGAVLLQYFTLDQLNEMTPLLDPDAPTELNYYPLPDVGERFPLNDPRMVPKLEPLPGDSLMFLQGILEGIARIEAQGYATLMELGGPKVTAVWTTGSGSLNPAWTRIRERALGTRLQTPRSHRAAFGAALLAAGVLQRQYA